MSARVPLRVGELTLMRLRGPSRTQAHPHRTVIGSARPRTAFQRPAGLSRVHRPTGRSQWAALLGLSLPFRGTSPGPRAVPPVTRQSRTTLPLLGFGYPTTHFRTTDPFIASGSHRQRVPRTGFGYPPRDLHRRPYRRASAPERPWASPFKDFSSPRSVPLSGPVPSWRCLRPPRPLRRVSAPAPRGEPRALHEGRHTGRGRLQGFVPVTSSCCRWNQGRFQPSIPSWVSALQSTPPPDLVLALSTAPPLSPLDGLTSLSVRASGSRGASGWDGPSPDRQLSWASRPCDDRGAPFATPGGGLIDSPHTAFRGEAEVRALSPSFCDAAADPGPAARHRRPSVHNRRPRLFVSACLSKNPASPEAHCIRQQQGQTSPRRKKNCDEPIYVPERPKALVSVCFRESSPQCADPTVGHGETQ